MCFVQVGECLPKVMRLPLHALRPCRYSAVYVPACCRRRSCSASRAPCSFGVRLITRTRMCVARSYLSVVVRMLHTWTRTRFVVLRMPCRACCAVLCRVRARPSLSALRVRAHLPSLKQNVLASVFAAATGGAGP